MAIIVFPVAVFLFLFDIFSSKLTLLDRLSAHFRSKRPLRLSILFKCDELFARCYRSFLSFFSPALLGCPSIVRHCVSRFLWVKNFYFRSVECLTSFSHSAETRCWPFLITKDRLKFQTFFILPTGQKQPLAICHLERRKSESGFDKSIV